MRQPGKIEYQRLLLFKRLKLPVYNFFRNNGYVVLICDNGNEIIDRVGAWPNVFIIDRKLSRIEGVATLKKFTLQPKTCP
jgi:DNA-binding response OmpR family regulator